MSTNSKPISSHTAYARRKFIHEFLISVGTGRGVMGKLTLLQLYSEAQYLAEQVYPE